MGSDTDNKDQNNTENTQQIWDRKDPILNKYSLKHTKKPLSFTHTV